MITTDNLSEISALIDQVLYQDRFYLRKRLQSLKSLLSSEALDASKAESEITRFETVLNRSAATKQSRLDQSITLDFPEALPVSQRHEELASLIEQNQVVIVAGETGSGKTTQLGKICLSLGRGILGQIAHTQPRRVAATSVARRIAEEVKTTLGDAVGFEIRFQSNSADHTRLKLMTDGVLLAEIAKDRFLSRYDTIIIDEAHERSLNIDFLLGYLKNLLPKRPELKVIITSATIDLARFSKHFNDAPVIEISGRTYSVEKRYSPVEMMSAEGDINEAIVNVLEEIEAEERSSSHVSRPKDVLVFLPGENDIRMASLALKKSTLPLDVLPLYARLNAKESDKIFNPGKSSKRRVILATNVAETSLTVPGIGYVIDSGLARLSRYSTRAKVQRLPIEKVAKSSADQRAGRCGRVAEGVCYRLYSEEDFLNRPNFTEPEIKRTNLAQVVLQMHALGLGDIERFPFVERPEQKLINDGTKQLLDLAALDQRKRLTKKGREMVRWPLDPKLSSMLIAAKTFNCLREMLVIVAGLASQDPREAPHDKKDAAREKHKQFADEQSDFIAMLNLFNTVEAERQALSNNQFRQYLKKRFLSFQKVKEWRDVHKQLMMQAKQSKLTLNQEPANYKDLHVALLTGFAAQVGLKEERSLYQGTRNRQFRLFPGSGLYKKSPKWVMVAELLETSQLFGHRAAKIEPQWIVEAAPQLLKFDYLEPHFSRKQGRVVAYQKTSLYGLTLEDKRIVGYSQFDKILSRELFIRQGLVEEQLQSKLKFYLHNKQLREEVELLEEKQRRRDLLVNDEDIFLFYDERLPDTIHNLKSLEAFCKKNKEAKSLFASRDDFLQADESDSDDFPSSVTVDHVTYKLSYRFQPGKEDDGLCVRLPLASLNRVPRFYFDWLVPGLLREKVEALLKTLPKQLRKQLVPIPDTVNKIMPYLTQGDVSLVETLCKVIRSVKGIVLESSDFQPEKLDNFYLARFELRDEHNQVITQSRDLSTLLRAHGGKVQKALDKKMDKAQTKPDTRWTFGEIPKEKHFKQSGSLLTSFPALEDCGEGVRVKWMDSITQQRVVHREGLVKLAQLYLPQQIKYLRKQLFASNKKQLQLTAAFDLDELREDLLKAAVNLCFFAKALPFDQAAFEKLINEKKSALTDTTNKLAKIVEGVLESDYAIRQQLNALTSKNYELIVKDVSRQRKALVFSGFIYATPIDYLDELPRYFKALQTRLEKLGQQLAKDVKQTPELLMLTERMVEVFKQYPELRDDEALIKYRWMMEEYRVSVFAQSLKTKYPISLKRLDKQWREVEKIIQAL